MTHTHLSRLERALQRFADRAPEIEEWGLRLASVLEPGGRLLACGNGGSAAQAQHLTAELVGRYQDERRPFSALPLHADTSSVTAIVNDYGADEVFARQVRAHGREGDVLLCLSTSGSSSNLLSAVQVARAVGIETWALTGPEPNPLAGMSHHAITVEAEDTCTIQEVHLAAVHMLCAAVDAAVREPAGRRPQGGGRMRGGPLVVLGDTLLDVDLDGTVHRVSPDAPVPVVEDVGERPRAGGAGLAAALAARLSGGRVTLVTALGTDPHAERLAGLLGRTADVVALPLTGETVRKTRVRAGGQPIVRVDRGDGRLAPRPMDDATMRRVADVLHGAGAVLVADYGRGVAAHPDIRRLLAEITPRVCVVWDPHPRGARPVQGVRLVTPNQAEARGLAGEIGSHRGNGGPPQASRLAGPAADAAALVSAWRATGVAVTLGASGALLSMGEDVPVVIPAPETTVVDTCGAGDCFAAATALALRDGALLTEAVEAGVQAASAFVSGDRTLTAGTGTTTGAEPQVDAGPGPWEVVRKVQDRGGTVVATGGCFDLLHAGHVGLLGQARSLGDCLVVCLNSDRSVRELKGPGRPLVSEQDRARVLSALDSVDAVIVFAERTPVELLERLRPDLWVKGGDYSADELVEAEVVRRHGGEVVLLPYVEGYSTTGLVERAHAMHGAGLGGANGGGEAA